MIKVSLFAEQERESKLDKIGDALSKLGEHVDFVALAEEIDEAALRPGRERGGPTELMVRVLVVQQLYNLSDEQMDFQLLDRLSLQRFVGLRQSSQAPDRTTIWTVKERLIKAGGGEKIFETVNRKLDCHGYIARGWQMIDTSIVPVPKQTQTKDEKDMVQQHVWADKGYVDGEREQRLGKTGRRLHIQPGKPLSACQARRNRRIAKPRALPPWSRWTARCCARSAWRGRGCT
ncbi:hypothetical protein WK09_00055 [Burkholderia ubonensis]|nr:hypothetical protein WK09_00055 [Burkholderia ubonensis]